MEQVRADKKTVEDNTYRIDWEDIVNIIGKEALEGSDFSVKIGDRSFSEKIFPMYVYVTKTHKL